jgi:hypothetical protein
MTSSSRLARLAGDNPRDVIAMVEAVDRQDYDGMAVILDGADRLGLTVGLAVLSAHLLRERYGHQASDWLATHRDASYALDDT